MHAMGRRSPAARARRDMRRHRSSRVGAQGVRSALLTEAMTFLEPWILRNNFNSAIKRHQVHVPLTCTWLSVRAPQQGLVPCPGSINDSSPALHDSGNCFSEDACQDRRTRMLGSTRRPAALCWRRSTANCRQVGCLSNADMHAGL